jgi:hypothetical protein
LAKLLGNDAVKRYVIQQSQDIYEQLKLIAELNSLDQP